MTQNEEKLPVSAVYGPVNSWRLGKSLGIDVLLSNSICSFRCIYCQLGKINKHTSERKIYVPTEKVMADLMHSDWRGADVISLSGSGEPTLAANLGEVVSEVKSYTGKPVVVLTNATLLHDPAVRNDLSEADKIFCKLDATNDRLLSLIDRPVEGITVRKIVDGIRRLRSEYSGFLAIQTMLMPFNISEIEKFLEYFNQIRPDEIQLNLPSRPIPRHWDLTLRGNHQLGTQKSSKMKLITSEELKNFAARLSELTGLKISCAQSISS